MNVALGDPIVMMGANASILRDLSELFKMFSIVSTGESSGIVTEILRDNNTKITSKGFESFFGLEIFVSIEMDFVLYKDKARWMVNKEGTSTVLMLGVLFTKGMWQATMCGT
ncbi:MAG: hypothetical protein R6V12_04815, partial [Candidatus Hydrogenedentota bacterium]